MSNLKVMPSPKPRTDVEEVAQRLRGVEATDIVAIFRSADGTFEMLTNQGDAAGTLFFLDQFRHAMLMKAVKVREGISSS